MNNPNNALLNNFYRHQQMNIPFQQNNLLRNNPALMANMQYQKSQQMQQMKMMQMQQNMQRMKMQQELKKKEKEHLNKIQNLNKFDKADFTKAIIQPEESKLTKKEKDDIDINYKELDNQYGNEEKYKKNLKKYWDKRTNQPYKNILKDEDYTKNFKKKDDLIVHKVTDLDKDAEKLELEFQDKDDDREKHDGELKMIYSTSKEAENKKKFEYNNVYKFRMKYDPKDHEGKKQDKIDYYKKEQKKLEKGNKKFNEVIEHLVNNSLFNKDQLENLGITTQDDEINVDMNKIEQVDKELKEHYGEEYDKLMRELDDDDKEEIELDKKEEERRQRRENKKKTKTNKSNISTEDKVILKKKIIDTKSDEPIKKKKATAVIKKKAKKN